VAKDMGDFAYRTMNQIDACINRDGMGMEARILTVRGRLTNRISSPGRD
jgi:hypothetical protein